MTIAGVDVAQNFIPTVAEARGLEPQRLIERNRAEILEAFERGRIHYDPFVDPQQPGYARATAAIVAELVECR